MPRGKGTKAQKEAKRRIVAKGSLAGKRTRQIAKEAGCSQRHVERLASEPQTQLVIAELMKPHYDTLGKLTKKAITAVDQALGAKNTKGRPEHEIRLRAVGRLGTLLHLAQGDKAPDSDGQGLVTWEEFVVLYTKRTEGAAA